MNTTKTDMKKLSKTLKKMGVDFSFPLEIKDANGNLTYFENSDGYRERSEYDANGKTTYFENSDGYCFRCEYDANGYVSYYENSNGKKRGTPRSARPCEGKVVEVDGIQYELKAL